MESVSGRELCVSVCVSVCAAPASLLSVIVLVAAVGFFVFVSAGFFATFISFFRFFSQGRAGPLLAQIRHKDINYLQ